MGTRTNFYDALTDARCCATSYESMIETNQRKRLGQFFSGLPLSRLLASISVKTGCSSVIDPMAGHGDLLDAVLERASRSSLKLKLIDAIEIDPTTAKQCRNRLEPWVNKSGNSKISVLNRSAFDPELLKTLPQDKYDLVITNPPYVRYQTVSQNGDNVVGTTDDTKSSLLDAISHFMPLEESSFWHVLVKHYSGLSDLSVPSWLLAAMMVKPGGVLAIVAPATWRNRDYADVLQYMLARFFRLDIIVADKQPGWFSTALVRTHLVVATRLSPEISKVPLCLRPNNEGNVIWAEIDSCAKLSDSLIGMSFPGDDPEGAFGEWIYKKEINNLDDRPGIKIINRPLGDELSAVLTKARSSRWMKKLEHFGKETSLFSCATTTASNLVPNEVRDVLRKVPDNLAELNESGIQTSQGLRTGCNEFFYVEMIERQNNRNACIRVSPLMGNVEISLPLTMLKPVLRKQSELTNYIKGVLPSGYVLDLRCFVLPEDFTAVKNSLQLYKICGMQIPAIMPDGLAEIVRRASKTIHGSIQGGRLIPDLSAVRTNVRSAKSGNNGMPPRFWYMLPDFTRRHLPDAFIPRVNQDSPLCVINYQPPILIDANFSTLWSDIDIWTPPSILALLNSTWVRLCMEYMGTSMGGGALKLEATHIRRLPVPKLTKYDILRLDKLGLELQDVTKPPKSVLDEIDQMILMAIFQNNINKIEISKLIDCLREKKMIAKTSRQRR